MAQKNPTETMENRWVTYTTEVEGRVIVIEHLPAAGLH